MITQDNFKDLLITLNFKEEANIFTTHFPTIDAYLKVDFDKKLLVYPTNKGFIVNGEFTCNFSSNENFVVFECVYRLLAKGYKPEHIELEPKWKVGHGASGGRADILVKDNTGKSLLIIECKTEGSEFKKEWENTKQRGGQMLTYAKQAGTTQYVCLYTADFTDNRVVPSYYIISLNDNENLLQELADQKPLSFQAAKAMSVDDIYDAWKKTYNLDYATKGIFEDDIQAYQIGKQNYSTKDLLEVGSKDIQKKYHEFATILRQHNVSGRENAFDKLVNLFLCKIVDETKNPNNLKFYWKGIAYDSYFDLQDRLQLLYQAGMKEFLGEDVTYIDNTAIDQAFRFVKKDPDATKDTIKKYFRQLKFFTNNDFAFIDVHNEKLFYQNAEVLLKIVQMLQDTRLQSEVPNQFLGDMFEGFLDNGIKQSEGQFFTPMPIVKFILNALPLESIIEKSELPPKAIDYACGAGHFLNELALQIKPLVEKHKQADIKSYYKEIIGIEKEYRLSKVAKVSAFMYGQDDIKIMYADALADNTQLQNDTFSILVANPPYSVKGFLQTLSESERKAFTLLSALDEKGQANNNSIETFFIERANQLLKADAVAGIVLPSSILSNDAAIYIHTREIILKYFQIVAITEFGSQTFGKTGTNTVTLFLRKKKDNPSPADHWRNRVAAWFGRNEGKVVYSDSDMLTYYCQHIGVELSQYQTLLAGKPSAELLENEVFVDYKKAFDGLTETKNLLKQKYFKAWAKDKQNETLAARFVEYLQAIEKDKLYFFVLARENAQKVLVVKCPTDNKEQKQFLGYEWSNAKGNEGIKYINQANNFSSDAEDEDAKDMLEKVQGLHNINTPLYNPHNTNDEQKINYFIQQNFLGNQLAIPEVLSPFIAYHSLTDMLDFARVQFNKQISLTAKKNSTLPTKWDLVKLNTLVESLGGLWTGKKTPFVNINVIRNTNIKSGGRLDFSDVAKIEVEKNQFENRKLQKGDIIIEKSGGSETQAVGRVVLFDLDDIDYSYSNFTNRLRVISDDISPYFLHLYLNYFYDLGLTFQFQNGTSGLKNLDLNRYLDIKIPLPPLAVQEQLVADCNAVDAEVATAQANIAQAKEEIENLVKKESSKYPPQKFTNFVEIVSGGTPNTNNSNYWNGTIPWLSVADFSKGGRIVYKTDKHITELGLENSNTRYLDTGDLIISARGTVGALAQLGVPMTFNQSCYGLKGNDKINNTYLFFILKQEIQQLKERAIGMTFGSIVKETFTSIKIPVPPIAEQEKLVAEIEQFEGLIATAQAQIDSASERKKAIITKYL